MTNALAKLTASIELGLIAYSLAVAPEPLTRFPRLQKASVDLYERFDRAKKALLPPQEKRRVAINRFRNALSLNPSEWRMVFAGLADKSERVGPLLEDEQLFDRVHSEVRQRIERQKFSRRDWLALCFSYFGYESDTPADNANWCVLRDDVRQGFECVRSQQKREKEWIQIVQHHQELFTDQAGAMLGELMFNGEISDLSLLQTIAQIPVSSWLWRRIFNVLLSRISNLDDVEFSKRIPDFVEIGQLYDRYLNDILIACLTRYHHAYYREQPSTLLKQTAQDNWGSPQILSKQNSWLQYVKKDVCAMVVAWFAKEDLEHFFKLLKGDAEVDQARLHYWLRFANQMSYTRIVMGADAWNERGRDFVHFREKNKGRLGKLMGGPGHNNAVIMQIGKYLFVEFSGTGNACFVYKADDAPFNPEKYQLDLKSDLKQADRAVQRMLHTPAPSRPTRIEGWLHKFDNALRGLRISIQSQTGETNIVKPRQAPYAYEAQVQEALKSIEHQIFDMRSKGGVYQVQLSQEDLSAIAALQRLGFKPVSANPLRFWKK